MSARRSPSAVVVVPTLNGRALLEQCLESLASQPGVAERGGGVEVVVVDNASTDGTPELVAERFPWATLVRNERNLGFGKAINAGVAAARSDPEVVVLVNNDTVLLPGFLAEILAPFGDEHVGMVAGVLLQGATPGRIDSAGIEFDRTLRSADLLWDAPVTALEQARDPVGPCGGAAAYRASAFASAGGFDPGFFAYWEDVDLALRLQLAGWECRLARRARALHRHGATVGATSPLARRLEAFGRGFVLERYGVGRTGLVDRALVAAIDWPALVVHLVARREAGPIRARLRGRRSAAAAGVRLRAPVELATVPVGTTLARQWRFLAQRLAGRAPRHFY